MAKEFVENGYKSEPPTFNYKTNKPRLIIIEDRVTDFLHARFMALGLSKIKCKKNVDRFIVNGDSMSNISVIRCSRYKASGSGKVYLVESIRYFSKKQLTTLVDSLGKDSVLILNTDSFRYIPLSIYEDADLVFRVTKSNVDDYTTVVTVVKDGDN